MFKHQLWYDLIWLSTWLLYFLFYLYLLRHKFRRGSAGWYIISYEQKTRSFGGRSKQVRPEQIWSRKNNNNKRRTLFLRHRISLDFSDNIWNIVETQDILENTLQTNITQQIYITRYNTAYILQHKHNTYQHRLNTDNMTEHRKTRVVKWKS